MNILVPDSWLREFLKTDATPKQLSDSISLCGPTFESSQKVGDDIVYTIEVTTNRVDMASVYGIAREAAAILPHFNLKAELKPLSVKNPDPITYPALPMNISDPEKNCNRILGIVMEVDPMKPSPEHVKDRLEKSGIRALNNLVDITNYVMLELGHPSHVFDYDRVKTHTFLIRNAKKGEKIITLDNKSFALSTEDVIIDDGTGRVIDLPGIMGTENSVVNEDTKRIIFFIESNKPEVIRKTSMRYAIRTMAAAINEKHPDPELAKTALLRGIQLYKELAGAKIKSEIIDIYPHRSKPKTVSVSIDFINDRLGIKLKKEEIVNMLESLNFKVETENRKPKTEILLVTPPTFRQFDVEIPEDIVEEVARIYGYHNLSTRMMEGPIPSTRKPKDLSVEEKIKTTLKYWGFTETYHYSFIPKNLIGKSGLNIKDHLKVANPLTEETEYMRTTLITSMLETVEKNQHYKANLELFELSKVYIPGKDDLPAETSMLCIVSQKDFYHLKGIVEALLSELGITKYESKLTNSPFLHPLQTLQFSILNSPFSILGTLHPSLAQSFNIKNPTYVAYINIEHLVKYSSSIKHFTPIPQYPPVIEDITLAIPPKTPIGPIIEKIYKTSHLVKNVEVVGKYENKITFRISYQDLSKNLKLEEISILLKKIPSLL